MYFYQCLNESVDKNYPNAYNGKKLPGSEMRYKEAYGFKPFFNAETKTNPLKELNLCYKKGEK